MLEDYKSKLETILTIEDDKEVRETLIYYTGFIEGLLSIGYEGDEGFIALLDNIINEYKDEL